MPDTQLLPPARPWPSYSSLAPFADPDHTIKPAPAPSPLLSADRPDANQHQQHQQHQQPHARPADTALTRKARKTSADSSVDWRTSPPNAPSPLLPFAHSTHSSSLPPQHHHHPADMSGGAAATAHSEARPAKPMRNTPNGESFAKDFIDIFTTLMISLPLTPHRVRFKSYPYTFTTEEALQNMANLRLTQTNRMDDPKNPGRIVTTTTSTSFSIGRDMARTIGAQFVQARLVEPAVDSSSASFEKDKSVWKITPKGTHVLQRFANRNGIAGATLSTLLANHMTTLNLIILERDDTTDEILESASLIELIFRRFAGPAPNIQHNGRPRPESFGSSSSDHSVGGDQMDGYTGVLMREGRRIGDVVYQHCFTGQDALNWLLESCTTVKQSEAQHLASTFLKHNLIARCGTELQRSSRESFDANSYYILTERGKRMAGWTRKGGSSSRSNSHSPPSTSRPRKLQSDEDSMSLVASAADNGTNPGLSSSSMVRAIRSTNGSRDPDRPSARETSTAKLQQILNDPALLTLFREFLRQNFCEENLQFYRETGDFIKSVKHVQTIEQVKAALATAFSHYNAFLAQGSPCELNLDHSLRLDLAARMSKAVDDNEDAIRAALAEVVTLFERARSQVLRLMASDSVPKFVQTPRYRQIYGEEHLAESAFITPPPEVGRS